MGLFPTLLRSAARVRLPHQPSPNAKSPERGRKFRFNLSRATCRIRRASGQPARSPRWWTLVSPLLRGLKILQQQRSHPALKRILGEVSTTIEWWQPVLRALRHAPAWCSANLLSTWFVPAKRAALEIPATPRGVHGSRKRLKGKVQSAMFYPVAVMFVAGGVMTLMMLFVIPKFKDVFAGLTAARTAGVHQLVLNAQRHGWHHALSAVIMLAVSVTTSFPAHHPHQV